MLITATKVKSVGMVTVPLAAYADRPALEEELQLDKCPDKNAYINLKVHAQLLKTDCGEDTLSQMSDLRSIDSPPRSEFDFGDLANEGDHGGSRAAALPRGMRKLNANSRKLTTEVDQKVLLSHQGKPPLIIGGTGLPPMP